MVVRDDAVDSAHGAAAEGGGMGKVRVSRRSRSERCARGGAGGRGASRAPRKKHPVHGRCTELSSKGGIRDGTYRPSSRPRPSREKLGNESIVVMIYGRDVGRQSRLSRVCRAPERARAGAIKGGGGASGASSASSYFRSTLEATGTGIRGTCRPKARARGVERCVNRALTAREPRGHTDENRSIERDARVRRARPCARVPTVRFFPRRKKPDGKPEAPLAGRKARGGCAPLVFRVLKGRDRFGRNPSTVQRCEFLSLHVDVAARGPSVECDYGESMFGPSFFGAFFQTYENQTQFVMFLATRTSQLRRSMGRNRGVSRGKS